MSPPVRRGFADTPFGQVHYREAGRGLPGVPLVMLHPSPGSAKMLEPLIAHFGQRRHVIAPDTIGNGDSAPPPDGSDRPIPWFAAAHLAALADLGLERFDLYGAHTGANIACEMAIAEPHRARRLIIDGISLYSPAERADMLENYCPGVPVDQIGSQLHWVWHFVRDAYLYWPWYRRGAANRRGLGLPSAEDLHDKVLEVLKAVRTYHIPYRAAIAYEKAARLPLVAVPTLLCCAETDMFTQYFDAVQRLMPNARPVLTKGSTAPETLALYEAFLDATQSVIGAD